MSCTYTNVAAVLNQLNTIFLFILGAVFLGEPLTSRKVTAVALGFADGVLAVL